MLPTKFQVKWLFGSGEEAKNRFSGSHLGFPIGKILAIFDLKNTPLLSIKFQNWPPGSGEAKNRFSRLPPWRLSWISDWNNFSYFWYTSHPDASYQVSCQSVQQFRRSCWQCETLTDGRADGLTTDNRRSHKLTWSFAAGELMILQKCSSYPPLPKWICSAEQNGQKS